MREIALDTETTGLDPYSGHRIVEIGCVEMMNRIPTGREFHCYLNPDRDMPEEARRVHGITAEFLKDKPRFSQVVDSLLEFLESAALVIHNAEFDMKFLNAELNALGKPALNCKVVDTLLFARQKFPGSPASLDALCRRFSIDLTQRDKHGALLDAKLLAGVYLELSGGRQAALLPSGEQLDKVEATIEIAREFIPAREFAVSESEVEAHRTFLKKVKNPLWEQYLEPSESA